jgi:hypothetical protein
MVKPKTWHFCKLLGTSAKFCHIGFGHRLDNPHGIQTVCASLSRIYPKRNKVPTFSHIRFITGLDTSKWITADTQTYMMPNLQRWDKGLNWHCPFEKGFDYETVIQTVCVEMWQNFLRVLDFSKILQTQPVLSKPASKHGIWNCVIQTENENYFPTARLDLTLSYTMFGCRFGSHTLYLNNIWWPNLDTGSDFPVRIAELATPGMLTI